MRCIITTGAFARQLVTLADLMKVYEITFAYLPAYKTCRGELYLASGRFEVFNGPDFETVAEAITARLKGIRHKQIVAGLHNAEDTFNDD